MQLEQITKKKKRSFSNENLNGTLMSIIPVIGFAIFGLIPMILAIGMAFMEMRGFSFEGAKFVAFDNFTNVLGDYMFHKAIRNTLLMAIATPISILLSLLIAFLLTKNIKGKKVFRTIYFIPYVCSVVAITLMWNWIFNYNYGILNNVFNLDVNWLGDAATFIPCLIVIGIWSGTGYGIILYGAALTNVNKSLYEAASVDGANAFQSFWHITLPAISPTTFFLVITGLIGALQEFARPQILSSTGGPDNTGITVVFYLYRKAFQYFDMGEASAVAWILAIIIIMITALNFWLSRKWVSYD